MWPGALTGLTDVLTAGAENGVLSIQITQTESQGGFPEGKEEMFTMLPKPDFPPNFMILIKDVVILLGS